VLTGKQQLLALAKTLSHFDWPGPGYITTERD